MYVHKSEQGKGKGKREEGAGVCMWHVCTVLYVCMDICIVCVMYSSYVYVCTIHTTPYIRAKGKAKKD